MAKYKRKVQQALAARRSVWDGMRVDDRKGTTRAGSQNRKKGWDKSPRPNNG